MLALLRRKNRSPTKTISQWLRDWVRKSSAIEFRCCGEDEVERMAKDIGMSFRAAQDRGSRSRLGRSFVAPDGGA
jgi:hypothetical protein